MNKTKQILLFLVLHILSINCIAQIHTMKWNPGIITKEQKKYLDSCEAYKYDTLGNITNGSTRTMWLDGNYFEYIEIDSAKRKVSWKFRKSTDIEKEERKKLVLDKTNIHSLIGTQFPELVFVDIDGNTYNSTQFNNKVVYMNFWFVGCQPCELERTKLNQLYEKYQDNEDVIFLSFSNSSEMRTRVHLGKKKLFWPVAILNKELKKNLSFVKGYPTNVILNNQKYEVALAGLAEGTFLVIDEKLELLTQ